MQYKLDFSKPKSAITDEKRDQTITFRTGEKFKKDLTDMAQAMRCDVSALIFEYAIRGYLEDYKNVLLMQAHGEKRVRDLLA